MDDHDFQIHETPRVSKTGVMKTRRTEVAPRIVGRAHTFMRDPEEVRIMPAVRVFVVED
jgi:alkanesulfonate monooxygenase SsuD/methylene tetrahydromethanopterin reductase-like flavin-dependent oxidoreductase (luciferase family)